MRPVTKQAITQYNQDDYDVMRTYLFSQIAGYCSYCEQPISNDSAVEHKVPQSAEKGFPAFAVQWRNLLLACHSCNSTKSTKPDKNDVNHSGMNNEQWYMATLNLWAWPDRNPAMRDQPVPPVDEIYRLFKFERSARTQKWLAENNLLRKTWGARAPAWANANQTKTWIMPNDAYIGGNAGLLQRVQNTICGLNLNLNDTSDPGYNDRRVDNRDAAYTTAQDALTQLRTIYAAAGQVDSPKVILIVKAIREAALATGFWSVWFAVFRGALDNPANGTPWYGVPLAARKELLLRTLVYFYGDEQQNDDQVPLFRGTDTSRLNLAAFQ